MLPDELTLSPPARRVRMRRAAFWDLSMDFSLPNVSVRSEGRYNASESILIKVGTSYSVFNLP